MQCSNHWGSVALIVGVGAKCSTHHETKTKRSSTLILAAKMALWPTSKIRRGVVTYRLDATVQRATGYIADDGEKFIMPNKLEIVRKRNRMIERILDQKHYKSVGGRKNLNELESYTDIVYGTIVFNITGIPRSKCESFRSIAKVTDGEILQSKLEKLAILKYKKRR